MSAQPWSPEPWIMSFHSSDNFTPLLRVPFLYAADAAYVAEVYLGQDADRIVACVNALAGISDPAALVKSHAELLGAVRELARVSAEMIQCDTSDSPLHQMIARAEAARK